VGSKVDIELIPKFLDFRKDAYTIVAESLVNSGDVGVISVIGTGNSDATVAVRLHDLCFFCMAALDGLDPVFCFRWRRYFQVILYPNLLSQIHKTGSQRSKMWFE